MKMIFMIFAYLTKYTKSRGILSYLIKHKPNKSTRTIAKKILFGMGKNYVLIR